MVTRLQLHSGQGSRALKILFATEDLDDSKRLAQTLRECGCFVDVIDLAHVADRLRTNLDTSALFDVIVLDPVTQTHVRDDRYIVADFRAHAAEAGDAIRKLPSWCVMADGRRWNETPLVRLMRPAPKPERDGYDDQMLANNIVSTPIVPIFDEIAATLIAAVAAYQRRLLDQFDNAGLLIIEDHGRFRVRTALVSRRNSDGPLYYGLAAQRRASHWYTVARDAFGVQYEVDQFEELINRDEVKELDIQRFLEEHPHFLTMLFWGQAIPQLRLPREYRGPYIPDFILAPILAERRIRDSDWHILELKGPKQRLLGKEYEGRRRLSGEVHRAIDQLRKYRDYLSDPAHSRHIERILGRTIRRPRLAVLIGRRPKDLDVEDVKAEQERVGVRIVTYDEILDRQRAQYRLVMR